MAFNRSLPVTQQILLWRLPMTIHLRGLPSQLCVAILADTKLQLTLLTLAWLTMSASPLRAQEESSLPRIDRSGAHPALMVDGKPYLMLGAQVNNSSAWAASMPAVWQTMRSVPGGLFASRSGKGMSQRMWIAVEEGTYAGGRWVPARLWNGDQTDWGLNFTDRAQVLRVGLMSY